MMVVNLPFKILLLTFLSDDDDDDSESLSSDIDDRCESDISGIAHDEDLSSVMYHDHLEPSWFFVGNVIRSYRHCPNASLNATLTTVALLALFTVVGVGIGHYMGRYTLALIKNSHYWYYYVWN